MYTQTNITTFTVNANRAVAATQPIAILILFLMLDEAQAIALETMAKVGINVVDLFAAITVANEVVPIVKLAPAPPRGATQVDIGHSYLLTLSYIS